MKATGPLYLQLSLSIPPSSPCYYFLDLSLYKQAISPSRNIIYILFSSGYRQLQTFFFILVSLLFQFLPKRPSNTYSPIPLMIPRYPFAQIPILSLVMLAFHVVNAEMSSNYTLGSVVDEDPEAANNSAAGPAADAAGGHAQTPIGKCADLRLSRSFG